MLSLNVSSDNVILKL